MNRLLDAGRLPGVALLALLLFLGPAAAQDFTDHRDFQFIPSRSTLTIDGGFAGIKQSYHATGTFGLDSGYESGVSCSSVGCPPPPTHIPFARFDYDVAWLTSDNAQTYVVPFDDVLDLSSLSGAFIPTTPNNFYFNGNDAHDQPFHLDATLRGPLIHLVGESSPNCCDFEHLKLDAFAYVTPNADFNLDGVVNTADYLTWRANASPTNPDGTDATAANAANYDLWRAHFGEVTDFSAFAADSPALNASAVPEPATLLLAVTGAFAALNRRRR
jgi:hypothetical protein